MANRCLSFQLIHKSIFFIMNKKSNIDIDKMKLIKIIGRGMYGTVYLSKYKQKLFAYKIEHILEKDIDNKKSNIWKEINFSIKFANNYITMIYLIIVIMNKTIYGIFLFLIINYKKNLQI